MQLKQRSKIWIICLVAATLLLGAGIQGALAFAQYRRGTAEAAVRLAALGEGASETAAAGQARRMAGLEKGYDKKLLRARELQKLEILVLANPWNAVPEGYSPELRDIGNEYELDVRAADALLKMLDDCRAAGNYPYICSAYRTREEQEALYANKIARLEGIGVSAEEAPALAARSVALPGTSEHELGLAVDIIDEFYTNLDAGQENTSTQQWLMANSWRYGFILRYPNGSTDITGIIYEPWHYRYVGLEYAKDIYERGLTLEEYIALRRGR